METTRAHHKNTPSPLPIIGIESASDQCNEERACRIAEAAYYKAQARNFEAGHEIEDWLSAEKEEVQ